MTLEEDMLNHVSNNIKFFICLALFSCSENVQYKKNSLLKEESIKVVTKTEYESVYNNLKDSVKLWTLNQLTLYTFKKGEFSYAIDSLICFNSSGNRMINALHSITERSDGTSDGLIFMYGEKIDSKWYFFRGGAVIISRKILNQEVNKPLKYNILHEAALKEVYSGYLNMAGKINEKWFTSHFEGPGWGDLSTQHYSDWCLKGKRYTNEKEFYIAMHLCKVKANWMQRDTTKPIIQLPAKEEKLP